MSGTSARYLNENYFERFLPKPSTIQSMSKYQTGEIFFYEKLIPQV